MHQFIRPNETTSEILSSFCLSRGIDSIVSFELDDVCILPTIFYDRNSYFSQSNRITLRYFDHCIFLLKQIGSQLHSFAVNIVHADGTRFLRIYQIPTVRKYFFL